MNQIIMILLISLLVLVHEAGHFIAARMCGIRVTRFGIGMPIGPSWKLFKWGHTTFYLHAFLFGGYVAVSGICAIIFLCYGFYYKSKLKKMRAELDDLKVKCFN